MTAPTPIPAAPGWYLKTDDDPSLELIVAWYPTSYREPDGTPVHILLPYIANGPGVPPSLVSRNSIESSGWNAVYRPNHNPDTFRP